MNDPVREAASGRPGQRENWLAGRSDRKEYWICAIVLIAVYAVLGAVGFEAGSGASAWAMLMIQIRRFHDLGRTGWWAAALLVGQFAVAVPLAFMGPLGIGLATLISLAVLVVMGAIPGQPFENRFGPPRGQRPLSQVFS